MREEKTRGLSRRSWIAGAGGALLLYALALGPLDARSRQRAEPSKPARLADAHAEREHAGADNRARDLAPVARAETADAALHGSLYAIVSSLAAELRAALPAHSGFAEFNACVAVAGRPNDRCQTLIADVINYALFTTKAKARAGGDKLGVGAALAAAGSDDAAKVAIGLLTNSVIASSDPLERISALVALRFDPALSVFENEALPEAAYHELENRPLPEVQLLAERHRRTPVTGERIDEFVRLAASADDRAQTAALLALGHAPTASQLHEVVISLPYERSLNVDIARAAGTCGLPCAQTVQHLMTSGSAEVRIAMYEALGLAPDPERTELVELALASAPAAIDDAERTTRDSLLGDALAN